MMKTHAIFQIGQVEGVERRRFHRLVRPDRQLLILARGFAVDPIGQIARRPVLAAFLGLPVKRSGDLCLPGRDRDLLIELHRLGREDEDRVRKKPVIVPGLAQMGGQPVMARRMFHILPHRPAPPRPVAKGRVRLGKTVGMENVAVAPPVEILQRGMGKGDMVALVVHVPDRFPVDRQDRVPVGLDGRQDTGRTKGRKIRVIGPKPFRHRRLRPARQETDEDETMPDLHLDRFQPELRAVHHAECLGA